MQKQFIRLASPEDFEQIATTAAMALLTDPLLTYFGCAGDVSYIVLLVDNDPNMRIFLVMDEKQHGHRVIHTLHPQLSRPRRR